MPSNVRVGTRRSALARAQAGIAMRRMNDAGLETEEVLVTSHGDVDRVSPLHRAGEAGVFTRALEDALDRREIDVAVHSLKDLPLRPRFPVLAILPRNDPRDALLVRRDVHDPEAGAVPVAPGARVGTSAPRRQTQVEALHPEVTVTDVRGNVDTRLRFLEKGGVDALLVAASAFERMDLPLPKDVIRVPLDLERFPTCPGQGALALQGRPDSPIADPVRTLDDADARTAAATERAVLSALGGGCGMPLGVTASPLEEGWRVTATLAHPRWLESDAQPVLRRVALTHVAPRLLAREVASRLQTPWDDLTLRPVEEAMTLAGRRVLLVMDPATAGPYARALGEAGAEALPWPTTSHAERDLREVPPEVESAYPHARWIVVASPRGVPGASRLAGLPREGSPPRHAAVGPGTARALRRAGLPCHLVSPDGTAAGLARLLASLDERATVVAPGAADPRPELRAILAEKEWTLVDWPVYDTVPLDPLPAPPLATPVDALVLASPSAARALAERVGHDAHALANRFIAFGPTTAEAMKDMGLPDHAIARRRSPAGLLEVMTG